MPLKGPSGAHAGGIVAQRADTAIVASRGGSQWFPARICFIGEYRWLPLRMLAGRLAKDPFGAKP